MTTPTPMSTEVKQQAIIAAFTVAGGDEALIPGLVSRLGGMIAEGSAMMQAIATAEASTAAAPVGKPFPATIIHVDKEPSSTRGVIFFRNNKGEVESIRTERADSDTGVVKLLERLMSQVGHKVLITKKMERMKSSDHSIRVLVSCEDKGFDEAVSANPENFAMNWAAWDAGKNSPTSDKLQLAQSPAYADQIGNLFAEAAA